MAATRLISFHVNKGKSVAKCLADRTDYSQNAAKTNGGEFISSYECDAKTADEEFLLAKRQYQHITDRQQKNNVIAYQIRQSFKPGEVTPEEANQVGYELAMRFTKGNHAFIIATHIDQILREKPKNFVEFLQKMSAKEYEIKEGKQSAFRGNSQKRFIRLRSLGDGYSEEEIKAVIAGKSLHKAKNTSRQDHTQPQFHLLIDIQEKMAEGKTAGYERWAKKYNRKEAAKPGTAKSSLRIIGRKYSSTKLPRTLLISLQQKTPHQQTAG